jgi:hypothetical protein
MEMKQVVAEPKIFENEPRPLAMLTIDERYADARHRSTPKVICCDIDGSLSQPVVFNGGRRHVRTYYSEYYCRRRHVYSALFCFSLVGGKRHDVSLDR